MRKDFGKEPWLYPMPVLIVSAYGEEDVPNAMAIGWTGILDTEHLSICVMAGHKTTEAILSSGAFTAGVADLAHLEACDYLGTVSGKKVPDKVARAGFHIVESKYIHAPILEELPMTVECQLESFDPESGRLIGKIVNVSADERVLNEDGVIDAEKFETLTYDPCKNAYRTLGRMVGIATQVCNPNL